MKHLTILLILIALVTAGSAQWTKTNGPEGGAGYGIFEFNNKLFACTFDGMYVSTDSAASWKSAGLSGKAIYRTAVFGPTIYASVDDTLFSTSDDGISWQVLKVFGGKRVQDILLKGNSMFVAVYDIDSTIGGLYRSTDYGTSWIKTTSSRTFSYIRSLCSSSIYLIAATNYKGIYRTSDYGDTWEKVSNGLSSDPVIYTMLGYDQYVYAAGTMGFFYTTNSGDSWITTQNNGLDSSFGFQFYTITKLGKRILASMTGYFDGIMYSEDNGNNWYGITPGQHLPTSESPYAFSVIGQDCYAQIGNGIFRTPDGGVFWSEHNKGIPALVSDVGFSDGDTLIAWGPTGIFKTGNGGNMWTHFSYLDQSWVRVTGTIGFQGKSFLYGNELWEYTSNYLSRYSQGASDVVHLDTGLVSLTDQGFGYSSNGTLWQSYIIPQMPDSLGYLMRLVSSGTSLITYTSNLTLDTNVWYRYTDGGSWQKVHEGGYSSRILSSAVHKGVFYIGTEYGGLMRSEDDGLTWKQDNAVDPNAIVDILYSTGEYLFCNVDFDDVIATNGLNIRKENSDGFRFVGQGLPYATSLYLHTDGYLYAGSTGIWKRPIAELGISEPTITSSIQTIRPNPATDYIIVDEDATVTLFSSTGAEVFTTKAVQDERIALPEIASGVYIAKIETKSGVKSAKVVVQ